MSINKPNLKRVWANTAPTGNVIDPDTIQPGKFSTGWSAEVPPFEYFNYIQKLFSQGLAHINENGIPVWDEDTVYPVRALAKGSDGKVYECTEEDSGSDPTLKLKWKEFILDDLAIVNSQVVIGGDKAGELARRFVDVKSFGAIGNGATDDTTAVFNWISYLAANPNKIGIAQGGVFRVNEIVIAIPNGINIIGNATFKALGANRLRMITLVDATGKVITDGITYDGNNIVARPFEIQNIGGSTHGNVYIGPNSRFINAKNVAPLVFDASACRVQGKFNLVVFEGEVDGVDNSLTAGGVSVGFWSDWSGTSFVNHTVITSKARIKNVKNDNATTSDSDGVQCMGPTDQHLFFTVEPGAYFENCKGRSIKSQVIGNSINSPVIVRNAYDGLVEIDCQYAGGSVVGSRIFHDGVRVDNVIASAARLNLPSDFSMVGNILRIKNPPLTNSGTLCFFWGTDNTDAITQDGLICKDNKVIGGEIDHLVTVYGANVVDTNRITVKDNYAESISVSFLYHQIVFNNPSQMTVVFEGNSCKSPCVGATVVPAGRLIVESDRNNSKISPLPVSPTVISAGVITLYAGNFQLISTEGGSASDDVTNITGGNYSPGETVIFKASTSGQVPTFKNGVGNIFLAGSDFALDSLRDRLTLSYDSTSNEWHEVSRSNNG